MNYEKNYITISTITFNSIVISSIYTCEEIRKMKNHETKKFPMQLNQALKTNLKIN